MSKDIYHYRGNCVETEPANVPALLDMIDDGSTITRRTFLAHVDRDEQRELETQLGYEMHPSRGLTMAADYCVSYHRSKWRGKRCYYFQWSAIEYYFLNS